MSCPHCKSNFVDEYPGHIHCRMCGRQFNTAPIKILVTKELDPVDDNPRCRSAIHNCKICGRNREICGGGMCYVCHRDLHGLKEDTPEYKAAVTGYF